MTLQVSDRASVRLAARGSAVASPSGMQKRRSTADNSAVPKKKRKEKNQPSSSASTSGDPVDGSLQSDANNGREGVHNGSLHPELQRVCCQAVRHVSRSTPQCVTCTRRKAGDTCRFQGVRLLLKDNDKNIVGTCFAEHTKADDTKLDNANAYMPTMNFPVNWNTSLDAHHIRRIKRTIAQPLLPTLRQELQHLNSQGIIRRTRESHVRVTCDICMTSIFSTSWMCRLCGREVCNECFDQVQKITEDHLGASQAEAGVLQGKKENHAPFSLVCTRRNEHHAKDFSPVSRFCKDELEQAIKEMEDMVEERDLEVLPIIGPVDHSFKSSQTQPSAQATHYPSSNTGDNVTEPTTNGNGVNEFPDEQTKLKFPPNEGANEASTVPTLVDGNELFPPADDQTIQRSEIPSHDTTTIADSDLTEDIFRPLWAKGDPIVVTGLLPKFSIQWTPEYFIAKYNTESCSILECQIDVSKIITVGEFFSWFGKYEGRNECWKLKDWPPSTDFKTAFPELFEDFSSAVPMPNYVRRDGALNIASHFPTNAIAPDLGPKMYNAMASFEAAGSKGSTKLHMDMADAVNIMTYASPSPEGKPGCAAWDLFRAEDADTLRQFLREKFKGSFEHDPIHSQQFYLDTRLRKELYDIHKVKSHRVYQTPGEAVFIPAGCAHQVCNLADCVKVAIDFVSPENIVRCEKLTREFREQNQSKVWKEDVLQLRTMMWFAWLSCCRQENEMNQH